MKGEIEFAKELIHSYDFINVIHQILHKMAQEECYGCQTDHPSQRQHDICCMKNLDEHYAMYYKNALMNLLYDPEHAETFIIFNEWRAEWYFDLTFNEGLDRITQVSLEIMKDYLKCCEAEEGEEFDEIDSP